ncbi:MAG: PEP-CTERM sorting domain-containing protein [Desulfobacterales bacterium]|nr:PEP-CTERM sorting domain-containing protein [Desulfobacterales bacterium]
MKKALTAIVMIMAVIFIGSTMVKASETLFRDSFDNPDKTKSKWWDSNQDLKWGDYDISGTFENTPDGQYKLTVDEPTSSSKYIYSYANNYGALDTNRTVTSFDFMQKNESKFTYDGLDVWFEKKKDEDLYYDFNIEIGKNVFGYHLPGMADEYYEYISLEEVTNDYWMQYDTWYSMEVGFWNWGIMVSILNADGGNIYTHIFDPCGWNNVRTAIDAYGDPVYFDNFQVEKFRSGMEAKIYDEIQSAVPVPGAVWLLGSGLLGMVGLRRKHKNKK